MNTYPKWVYSPREDVTRNNMREYDRTKKIFYDKCLELEPNYYKLTLRERQTIRDKAEEILGYRR